MNNKYSDLSEEELVELIDSIDITKENLDEILVAMQEKGMKGGLIGFNEDDVKGMEASIGYIEYHEKIQKNKVAKKDVDKAIALLEKKNSEPEDIKHAIVLLAHTGEIRALRALEKYLKQTKTDEELATWLNLAIGECKMFIESKLEDDPKIQIRKMNTTSI